MSFAQNLKKRFSFSSNDGSRTPQRGTRPTDRLTPGSSGKRLPRLPTPDEEQQMSSSLKMKAAPQSNANIQAYGQFFLEYSIAAEFNHLKKQRLPGVYVIPSFSNPLVWFGVIFIRQGFYEDGVFRFTLRIPATYPDSECPTVTFSPPIFHPSINPSTGQLDLSKAFTIWRPNHNHIWQILLYMRRIFYKFDATDPVNEQAAQLFLNDEIAFKSKVQAQVEEISNQLYTDDPQQDDPHGIRFREWNPEIHEPLRQRLFSGELTESDTSSLNTSTTDQDVEDFDKPKLSGLSYIEPGSTFIFSKES